MTQPLTMNVTLFIKPECREEFLVALRDVLTPARQEPACIYLYATEAMNEPGRIVLFERWRDQDEYITDILQRDYFQRYLKISEGAYAAPRIVVGLTPIEPVNA
jgi:quinol monooxygenase YgiN